MPRIHNIDLIMNRLLTLLKNHKDIEFSSEIRYVMKFFNYLRQNAITKDGFLLKKNEEPLFQN